MAVTHR